MALVIMDGFDHYKGADWGPIERRIAAYLRQFEPPQFYIDGIRVISNSHMNRVLCEDMLPRRWTRKLTPALRRMPNSRPTRVFRKRR